MSPSRLVLVAAILLSGNIGCQAKPLSFNGIQLGQKWGPFLKAHPKAELYIQGFDASPLTKKQQLDIEGKKKEAMLSETRRGELFPNTAHFFYEGSLSFSLFLTELGPGRERRLVGLKEPLRKLVAELGRPTAQGVTAAEWGNGHRLMFVWERQRECTFACIDWLLVPTDQGPTGIEVRMVNAPWRATKPGFPTNWPAVLKPDNKDGQRKRQLEALLEELSPGYTRNIRSLQLGPAIDLFSVKAKKP